MKRLLLLFSTVAALSFLGCAKDQIFHKLQVVNGAGSGE